MKKECYDCKFHTCQLDIDYVPTHYCKKNIKDKQKCELYKEPYTVSDYISDIADNLVFLALAILFAIVMYFTSFIAK